MENETCEFEIWLRLVRESSSVGLSGNLLNQIAQEVEKRYGARIWFAEILGKRWSYRSGVRQDFPVSPLNHIPITPCFGLVAEGWEMVPEMVRAALLSFLRDHLASEQDKG
ncbi:MAG: hypothetical protein ABDK94_04975 [Atribacterota bacterium]